MPCFSSLFYKITVLSLKFFAHCINQMHFGIVRTNYCYNRYIYMLRIPNLTFKLFVILILLSILPIKECLITLYSSIIITPEQVCVSCSTLRVYEKFQGRMLLSSWCWNGCTTCLFPHLHRFSVHPSEAISYSLCVIDLI